MKEKLIKLWQLPQTLIALLVIKLFSAEWVGYYNDVNMYKWGRGEGLSLGKYIFLPFDDTAGIVWRENMLKHEYGHSIQSKHLGWLYPIVILIPSLIWCGCFDGFRKKYNVSYYSFYPEAWADKLGGVNRKRG